MEVPEGKFWCGDRGQYQRRRVPERTKPEAFGLSDWAKCFAETNVWDAVVVTADSGQPPADASPGERHGACSTAI